MLGKVEPLIQVRKWLRGLPEVFPYGHPRHQGHDARGGLEGQIGQIFKKALKLMCELNV